MPPFCPPQILLRLILGLLPVLSMQKKNYRSDEWFTINRHYSSQQHHIIKIHSSGLCLSFKLSYRPNLNSRVHVIVDVIIFQHSVAIVIEVDPDLWRHTHTLVHSWLWVYYIVMSSDSSLSSPMCVCVKPKILPASHCVSCSSSGLVCCLLSPTLLPACCCTPRSPLWRLVLFHAVEHKFTIPHRSPCLMS